MIDPDELTLGGIDGMRHLIVNQMIIKATTYAIRNLNLNREVNTSVDDRTVYRFVVALVMTNTLESPMRWSEILKAVMDLEEEKEN